jgi:predicted membrane metal-binding protein
VAKSSKGNFHEAFAVEDVPLPSERSTGLVFAAVAAIVAVFWRDTPSVLYTAGGIAAAFLGVALLVPGILRPLNIAWMRFAVLLNKVVSPLVMLILFAVVIMPFGLIMQLRSDPLRKRKKNVDSFWITRDKDRAEGSMTNQF